MVSELNGVVCLILSFGLGVLVLNPQVKDGIVMKAGMITASLGFFGCSWGFFSSQWAPVEGGVLFVNAGVAMMVFGHMRRARKAKAKVVSRSWPGDTYV